MAEELSLGTKFLLLGIMIISGAANTLVYKLQNNSDVTVDGQPTSFNHPYMQCMSMFFGEMLCYIIFFYQKKSNPELFCDRLREAESKGKKQLNAFYLLIPAMSDLITSTL